MHLLESGWGFFCPYILGKANTCFEVVKACFEVVTATTRKIEEKVDYAFCKEFVELGSYNPAQHPPSSPSCSTGSILYHPLNGFSALVGTMTTAPGRESTFYRSRSKT